MEKACPSIELLATYVDHNLTPQEQEQIESHLVTCQQCRHTVALVIKSQSEVPDPVLPKAH